MLTKRLAPIALPCLLLVLSQAPGCGAKTGLLLPEPQDATPEDGSCVPVDDHCAAAETCGNGLDDDCNGKVDEGCTCTPGLVQPCFAGPPGRRHVGACSDGSQVCELTGRWGACAGGILPRVDVCNGADNLCNGCSQQRDCPIDCPSPGDSRVPDGAPFVVYPLRGGDFFYGDAKSWRWQVKGGPCDEIATPSFVLSDFAAKDATLFPRLSGDYTVTLTVVTAENKTLTCTWVVHIAGPGLRVELCYPESDTQDLDLFLHKPGSVMPWYPPGVTSFYPNPDSCGWFNCEGRIRGTDQAGKPVPRADWGYPSSPLAVCKDDAYADDWAALGHCANPRLDADNNLVEASGSPENINIDRPRENESFRVMVQNFTGKVARPMINIYCDGRRVATYGQAPDVVDRFEGTAGSSGIGAMWRVCDVTTHVDVTGATKRCDVQAVHPPGTASGYDVTYDDPRF
jgi:hypothetical protein